MPGKVERECPACGDLYEADPGRLRFGRQTTCSRDCSYRLRGLQKEKRSTLVCPVCEAEFARTPRQIKAKHGASFCSPACQYAGRTLGITARVVTKPYVLVAPPQSAESRARAVATRRTRDNYECTDEMRARRSEATTRAMAEGRISAVSKLEDVAAKALDLHGVAYRRQVGIRGAGGRYVACVDFLLDDGRALEVNGSYWHTDPRVYPDGPRFPSQRRSAEQWTRKVSALESLGIPLVVVWELELRDDPAEAIRVALAAV
jgi:G:T-mismatch repair DNA endonuclease (very short patch repair protein)